MMALPVSSTERRTAYRPGTEFPAERSPHQIQARHETDPPRGLASPVRPVLIQCGPRPSRERSRTKQGILEQKILIGGKEPGLQREDK